MVFLKLFWTFFRIGLMNELAYRVNFYVQFLQSFLSLGTAVAALAIVFSHTGDLGGWKPAELVALLGVYLLAGGVIQLVIQPSMQQFIEDVRQGTLDFTLTKPEDAQLLVSVGQVNTWKLTDVFLGSGVLAVALVKLGLDVGFREAAAFCLVLSCGGTIIYSFWLILATLSFWLIRTDNILFIFQNMYEAGRWPIGIYPHWLRFILTFLVPVAFAVTVPAEALAGRLTEGRVAMAVCLAVAIFVLARGFWKHGVRNYSGASA